MKLLRLNDLVPFRDTLPNLGDRALNDGFQQLLAQQGDTQDSARWKAFPWLTGKAYAASPLRGEDWLKEQYRLARCEMPARLALERRIAHLARPLRGSRLLQPLDAWAERHTGLGLPDALAARGLRRYSLEGLKTAIDRADAVVFNGGGLLADHLGNYLPERLFELYLAKQSGKPVVIANYSLSLQREAHRELAAPVLRSMDLHLVREPASVAQLLDLGVDRARIIDSLDAAFALSVLPAVATASPPRIGLMIRGDRPVDFAAWGRFVERLRAQTGAEIHYLQNCRKYDPAVRCRLARYCRLDDTGAFPSLMQARTGISGLQLLITDRYHGVVFAMLSGVPVVPIAATTHKTQGLLDAAGYPLSCLPPLRDEAVEQLLGVVQQVLGERDQLAQHMREAALRMQVQVFADYRALLSRLRKLVNKA